VTRVREKIERIPEATGVYLMLDARGKTIYVGKAVNLRSRVKSYFSRTSDERALVPALVREIEDVSWIVTGTEKEAFILESTLIKRHRPRYNIDFKDDKSFVTVRIDPKERFPRISVVRRPPRDGALYFGPHASASGVRETIRFIRCEFGLRPCTDGFFRAHSERPCLQYEIGRCSGPCAGLITAEAYARRVDDAVLFLRGRKGELAARLENDMRAASGREEFELAARIRDRLSAIARTIEKQSVASPRLGDVDAIGLFREGDHAEIAILFVREGKLTGARSAAVSSGFDDAEILSTVVARTYGLGGALAPPAILLPAVPRDLPALGEWLREEAGSTVEIAAPARGERRRLVVLATRNAKLSLRARLTEEEERKNLLRSLQVKLGLARLPTAIECCDISNLQGGHSVGSIVAFRDGVKNREKYRRFRIKTVAGADDFASIREVVSRRIARAGLGADEDEPLPDLLVVDGGRGQLAAAIDAIAGAAPAAPPDVIALAKARLRARGRSRRREWSDERVFLPGREDPVVLAQDSAELHLLQRIRDEAHRFAIAFHRRSRTTAGLRSILDGVPGVGPARRRELLARFGGLAGLRAASRDEIAAVPGIGRATADAIVRAIAPDGPANRGDGSGGGTP